MAEIDRVELAWEANIVNEILRLTEELRSCEGRRRRLADEAAEFRLALVAACKSPPAVEMAGLLGQQAACPLCGAGAPWLSRECCDLGRLVGRVEGESVADALMGRRD